MKDKGLDVEKMGSCEVDQSTSIKKFTASQLHKFSSSAGGEVK